MTDPCSSMSWSYINRLLEALPGYAEITVHWRRYEEQLHEMRLMARDLPGPGRRFTNLTTGFEWFTPEGDDSWPDVVRIDFPALSVEAV